MVSMIICVAALFSGLLFLACAWTTRAGYWRTAAALMGGLAAAALRFGVDMAAFHLDLWTFGETAYAPVVTYVPVMFWFGAGLGLVGWRMIRNWGAVGELAFFAGFVLLGLGRDLLLATGNSALSFGQGPLPLVAAALSWLAMAILVQMAMQLLVGSVDSDDLAPERIPQIEDDASVGWS
ncbi:MAG TPA: hypothetical protein PLO65_12225 [Caulobacter sp.]|nr:hypothetical protein [Caulobacter sp.]